MFIHPSLATATAGLGELAEAFPQVRSFGRGSSRSPPTCAAEVATKEVLLLFLRQLGFITDCNDKMFEPLEALGADNSARQGSSSSKPNVEPCKDPRGRRTAKAGRNKGKSECMESGSQGRLSFPARMFQTAWPALAMLAATGLTTWRSHGLYPAAQAGTQGPEHAIFSSHGLAWHP